MLRAARKPNIQFRSIHRSCLISPPSVAVLQDGCIGSCRFEVAMSLVLLSVNRFEENEAAVDIDPEWSCFPYAGAS